MQQWFMVWAAGIGLFLGISGDLLAQESPDQKRDSYVISGTVTDVLGQPLSGVDLKLLTTSRRLILHTTTDERGRFTIKQADAGDYLLVAEMTGFMPSTEAVVFPPTIKKALSIVLASEEIPNLDLQEQVIRGPSVSPNGANEYRVTEQEIANQPAGVNNTITNALAQMPGVAIDQNQQIHIRNTEGPQFQYQINGVLVPLDINTNPPFVSMINPLFIKEMSLLDGILPSRYGFATGGVVDIQTKDGCSQPGGSLSIYGGQRDTIQPSVQYTGCKNRFSYYVSGLYDQSNSAFSSATPGPNAIHDRTNQGQAFGFFTYQLNETTKLSLITSAAASNNQLPNVPGLQPQFNLNNVCTVSPPGPCTVDSANINSYLNFRDYLAILALNGSPNKDLTYQLAYSTHYISQEFKPDNPGELIYQGVASTASHDDLDFTLEGDVTYKLQEHTLSSGFYLGDYRVTTNDSSLVFPVDSSGNQTNNVPNSPPVTNNARVTNIVSGVYVNDLWQITNRLRANVGLRWSGLTGFTNHSQVDPTINLSYLLTPDTSIHGGFARYMQVPSFQGISPNAPASFAGTSAQGPPGVTNPLTEDDYEWDIGVVHHLTSTITLSEDTFYELTHHYLDTGQFGAVPIFAPFNYDRGYIWGVELAGVYKGEHLSTYVNITIGRNMQKGVATGQFNFDPDELAYINSHHIVLDHQPLVGGSGGITYEWHPYAFSLDAIYSSGLRGGFADQEQLPNVVQVNFSGQRAFRIPGVGEVTNRIILLNILDRTNLIRPAEGIGIFQSAYGPRFTIYDALTIPF